MNAIKRLVYRLRPAPLLMLLLTAAALSCAVGGTLAALLFVGLLLWAGGQAPEEEEEEDRHLGMGQGLLGEPWGLQEDLPLTEELSPSSGSGSGSGGNLSEVSSGPPRSFEPRVPCLVCHLLLGVRARGWPARRPGAASRQPLQAPPRCAYSAPSPAPPALACRAPPRR